MVGKRIIKKKRRNPEALDAVVSKARAQISEREKGYREQSLKIHPWVCGRCGKTFTRENLHLLTVHHVDHNHDNNPADGSNWENLCIYCHDREHQKLHDYEHYGEMAATKIEKSSGGNQPFADLKSLFNSDDD